MKKYKYLTFTTWVVILLVWQGLSYFELVSSLALPATSKIVSTFIELLRDGYNQTSLWQHLGASFYRLFLAVFFALITAIPLGLFSGQSKRFRAIVDSLIQFYRPLPPLAYLPLLIIWMGIDDDSKIMLLYLAGFAPIYLACVSAVTTVKEDYINSARSLGASRSQIFRHVVLPAAMPQIFVGTRTAIGFAYTTLVSAEMVAATSGIGWMVLDARAYFKTNVIFVGIIIMGTSGVLMDLGMRFLENKFVFWKGK